MVRNVVRVHPVDVLQVNALGAVHDADQLHPDDRHGAAIDPANQRVSILLRRRELMGHPELIDLQTQCMGDVVNGGRPVPASEVARRHRRHGIERTAISHEMTQRRLVRHTRRSSQIPACARHRRDGRPRAS